MSFSPSKLFPFTNLPLIIGPEAERIIFLSKAGKFDNYLAEGFFCILDLKGLSDPGL